jgi:hypothetical protein
VRRFNWAVLLLSMIVAAAPTPAAADLLPLTVKDVRALPTPQLAKELLGERLASRVIEAERREYEGSSGSIPEYVEFFTQPELPSPVINGICRTDVIIVEYDWPEDDPASASTPLKIARVAAKSRYKSFPEPPGEPGSEEYTRAHKAACAGMKTARDSFRAPSGGDAQWLSAIHREYSDPESRFTFTCNDFADRSCAKARQALRGLRLESAKDVQLIDCPKIRTGDQVDYCYRLTFYYPGEQQFPEIGDYTELDSPEWTITVFAGMRDGMAPVRIRSLHLEHSRKSIGIP